MSDFGVQFKNCFRCLIFWRSVFFGERGASDGTFLALNEPILGTQKNGPFCFRVFMILEHRPTAITLVIKIHDIRHGFLLFSGGLDIPARTNNNDPCHRNT